MTIDAILFGSALLLLISILASKVSVYFGVPALLLFLLIGMLAGSEGPGGIYYDDPWSTQLLGVTALAFILFSGGLDTKLDTIRPVIRQGLSLATVGILITALLVGWFATLVLDFTLKEGVLLGAIVSATDAAAVFSMLRGKSVGLKGTLNPLLELESGSNDPMAIFLTLGMIRLLQDPTLSPLALVPMFIQQMGIGAAIGYAAGRLAVFFINRLRLEYEGLYPVLTVTLVLLTYGTTALLHGNGFLAVYLTGIMVGNRNFVHRLSLIRFHEGLAWLMQIAMFLTLGLLVFPSELLPIAASGVLVALFLTLAARPLSVFVSLAMARMTWAEKTFISWVGLRGAAPIILATFPLLAGIPRANTIFNLVFFIVLTSVLVQGTTLVAVAKRLGVHERVRPKPLLPLAFVPSEGIKSELFEVTVPHASSVVGRQIVSLGFPDGALIVLVGRGREFIVPRGSTTLEADDTLLILAHPHQVDEIRARVETTALTHQARS